MRSSACSTTCRRWPRPEAAAHSGKPRADSMKSRHPFRVAQPARHRAEDPARKVKGVKSIDGPGLRAGGRGVSFRPDQG